jgi:hypothetical protein
LHKPFWENGKNHRRWIWSFPLKIELMVDGKY